MINNTQTLIVLTPAFPKDEEDTVWVPSKQLFVKKLKENFPSLNVIVLTFNYPYHTEQYAWHGVPVISFNGMHTRKVKRVLLWTRVWRKLRSIQKQHTIIGIFSFWCYECALVGKYFARRHGIKHYCWISGMDAQKQNNLIKLIRPKAGELVAMSAFLVNEFYKNHLVKPQYTIPIGIDPSEFPKNGMEKDIDILGVGSFNPFKQYDVFIRVVKKLSLSFPGIKAVICGGGTEQQALEHLIKELQLENNVTLAGVKPHTEVLQWMQRAKVFLHPSSYEGFGAVCIEALYASAHVISFTYPLDHPVTHWQVAKDATEMATKAMEILQDPHTEYYPVLYRSMDDSAKAVMELFTGG